MSNNGFLRQQNIALYIGIYRCMLFSPSFFLIIIKRKENIIKN